MSVCATKDKAGVEITGGAVALKDRLVYRLLCPNPNYRDCGSQDSLSGYLYKPARERRSADAIIAFIDAAEGCIDKEDIDNALNHLKMQRLFAIVADMPIEIGTEERLRAWGYLLDSDWVSMFANPGDIDRMIGAVAFNDQAFAGAIYNRMKQVFTRKVTRFSTAVGFSEEIPRLSWRHFSLDEAIQGYGAVQAKHREYLPQYNAMVTLAMSLSAQTLVDN
ncbi:MAG: hypothetical protein EOT04_02570 [Candidatus Chaera renei]|uniref:Uncharacterized protein n=1 Tax=Candidatus Chaera renei TaxID=2506947 RepID=A0A4Q0AIY5_9BACT|nr:MAG: hypothetical protein EOT04_02570 [Candidatus Chaera renei]